MKPDTDWHRRLAIQIKELRELIRKELESNDLCRSRY